MSILFNNPVILPMTSAACPDSLARGYVGVEGNRITLVTCDAAEADKFRSSHSDCREIDCRGMILMPGLINTHCHAAMTLQRSNADDISLMSWLNDYIWPFEAKQTPEDVALGMELGIVEMLLGGVTSFVDMYYFEDRGVEVARRSGIRALLGCNYFDNNIEEVLPEIERAMAAADGCDRVRIAVAAHSCYTCSPENLVRGKEVARRHGLHFMTHISETQDEMRMVCERYGKSPVEHLDALGLLDDKTIGAHCVHVNDSDIAVLRDRGVAVSHNPQSNMKISSGVAPVDKMLREGVLCTIGTDGTCSNNDLDMWEEMRSATFLQKVSTGNPCSLPAYEALRMATVNGARAIGRGGELGVIREGALADIILIDTRKPHLCPMHDTVANLVYCAKASDVDTVMVDGRIVVDGRRVSGVDMCRLLERVQATADDVKSRVGSGK